MIPENSLNLDYVRAALKRRTWYIVLPFFIISMATVAYCIYAPKIYQSNALILLLPQEVPQDYVKPTVTSDIRLRFNTVIEQLLSRSRLEKIITKYDLYPEIRAEGDMHSALLKMRKNTKVSFLTGRIINRGSPPAFEISFTGQEPTRIKEVVDDLCILFLEENYQLRETQAVVTSRFLENELERMRRELQDKEELVRRFREEHLGSLPEQKGNNQLILSQLQQQLDSINAALQQTEDRKVMLQFRMKKVETLLREGWPTSARVGGSMENLPRLSREEQRRLLQELRSRYSDKHPDVLRLAAELAASEREDETTDSKKDLQEPRVTSQLRGPRSIDQLEREELNTELKLLRRELQSLNEEKKKTIQMIEEYRQRIESGPEIEQKFVDLGRDYEMATKNYETLLEKKMNADLAENLEHHKQAEHFKVQDPANLARRPFKPNIQKTVPAGFVVALLVGLGLAFVRESMDPTFWSSEHLEDFVELPVFVSLPAISTKRDQQLKRLKRVGTYCALVIMGSALLGALVVLVKDEPTVLPTKIQALITKLLL